MAKENTTKKIAVGALVAGAVGYVAGILTAPKSGKETRKDVKDAAVKAKTSAERELKKLHSELSAALEKAKKGAGKFKHFADRDFEKAVNAADKAKNKAKEMLTAIHEGGAEDEDLQKAIGEATQAIEHLKKFASKE